MALGQIIALVMVNKCEKFHWGRLDNGKVMAKLNIVAKADYTRVIPITQLFFFEKTDKLKKIHNYEAVITVLK